MIFPPPKARHLSPLAAAEGRPWIGFAAGVNESPMETDLGERRYNIWSRQTVFIVRSTVLQEDLSFRNIPYEPVLRILYRPRFLCAYLLDD